MVQHGVTVSSSSVQGLGRGCLCAALAAPKVWGGRASRAEKPQRARTGFGGRAAGTRATTPRATGTGMVALSLRAHTGGIRTLCSAVGLRRSPVKIPFVEAF